MDVTIRIENSLANISSPLNYFLDSLTLVVMQIKTEIKSNV
jgi:hypothetical protein